MEGATAVSPLLAPNLADTCGQPSREVCFIHGSSGEIQNGSRRIGLIGPKGEPVDFQEKDAGDEACSLVTVDKRVVANDADRVSSGHLDHVRLPRIGVELTGTSQCGQQKSSISQACRAAVECQEPIVDGEDLPLLDPDRLFPLHLESARKVLR